MYLIMKCKELSDQFECDAMRTPVCLTENPKKYGHGYEIYKVRPDNTFELVKDYVESIESGFALVKWLGEEEDVPKVLKKFPGRTRNSFTKTEIQELKKEFGFSDSVNEIFDDIRCTGCHGEVVNFDWCVFGEYEDSHYDRG